MFDDTTNNNHAHPGRIVMSNLCSEITQVSSPSKLNVNLQYEKLGEDICCNLGSVNIAKIMESGNQFEATINNSIRSLDHVSKNSDFSYVPTIEFGNEKNHALGLGAMNLHGFLATNSIYYDSPEAIDFTNMFFYTMAYYAFKTSNQMARENGKPFVGFEKTKFADGSYFDKYIKCFKEYWQPKTDRVKQLFKAYGIAIPSQNDWINLVANIKKNGIANAYLMAVAPTGSISYLSSCTPSLQPVVELVETRKQGKLGRIYFPAYNLNEKTKKYYENNAYKMGPIPIINIVAAAQQHVDQAISLTFFVDDKTTTRELNKAYIYAFKKRCKTIYYVRVRQEIIDGSESYQEDCQNCVI